MVLCAALTSLSPAAATADVATPSWVGGPVGGPVISLTFTGQGVALASSNRLRYRSTDGGATWAATDLPPVYSMAVAASDPQRVYAADLLGLEVSNDGGVTWQKLPDSPNTDQVVVDPIDADTVFVVNQADLWRSSNGGQTWTRIESGLPTDAAAGTAVARDLVIDPAGSDRMWVSSADGVYRTIDAGASWTRVLAANYPRLAGAGGVLMTLDQRSTDGGDTWNPITHPAGQTLAEAQVWVDPSAPAVAFESGGGLFRTGDGGATWHQVRTVETDLLAFDPSDQSHLLAGGPDGIASSLTTGNGWRESDDGFAGTQIHGVTADATLAAVAYADGFRTIDSGRHWTPLTSPAGPVVRTLADVNLSGAVFSYGPGRPVEISPDFGDTWSDITGNLPAPATAMAETRSGTLVAFVPGVGVFTDSARGTWHLIHATTAQACLFATIAHDDEDVYAVLSNEGLMSLGLDGSANSIPTPPSTITSLEYGSEGLLIGTNAGIYRLESGTWRLLPGVSTAGGHVIPRAISVVSGVIYVAMANLFGAESSDPLGLYASGDSGATWRHVDATISATSLAVGAGPGPRLYTGTDWQGVIVRPLPSFPTVSVPTVRLIVNRQVTGQRVPIEIRWTHTSPATGICGYRVEHHGRFGQIVSVVTQGPATRLQTTIRTRALSWYGVRAIGCDGANGPLSFGRPVHAAILQETDQTHALFSGGWVRQHVVGASGDHQMLTLGHSGRVVWTTTTPDEIGYLASTGPQGGWPMVGIEGRPARRVSLRTPRIHRRMLVWAANLDGPSRMLIAAAGGPTARTTFDAAVVLWAG
jgi:photosystem II stability/assembly factor-like uncharacterized protein